MIPIGSRATTPSPGIIFAAFGDAHKEAPKPHQSDGKDSENSHFETQSADFLPRSQGPRDKTPPPPQSQGPRAETPFPSSLPGAVRRDTLFLRSRRTVRRERIRSHRAPTAREETVGLPRLKLPGKCRRAGADRACCIPLPAGSHGESPFRIPLTTRRCALLLGRPSALQRAFPKNLAHSAPRRPAARRCAFPRRARHDPSRETPPQSTPGNAPYTGPLLHRIFAIEDVDERNEGVCAVSRYESVPRTTAASTRPCPGDMVHELERRERRPKGRERKLIFLGRELKGRERRPDE